MGIKDWFGPIATVVGGTRVGEFVDAALNRPSNKFKKQYEMQKEFAQNALQWRVADATAAGLHPLAALGMPLSSYNPVSVGGETNMQSVLSDMGADITRAATAYADPAGKVSEAAAQLSLTNMQLQNDKLAAEIRLLLQPGSPPGITPPFGQEVPPAMVSSPRKNELLQPHYGEGADVLTYPDLAYDLLRQPGNILNPKLEADVRSTLDAAMATLRQWYTPGGWNRYWRN